MRKILLNLFALLLIPPGVAFGQAPSSSPTPPPAKPDLTLTELQKARLDAARQQVFRWQDKMQAALEQFSALCVEAQKENKWAPVTCSLADLSVAPQPPPTPTPAAAKEGAH
jgi:hypothetical protein